MRIRTASIAFFLALLLMSDMVQADGQHLSMKETLQRALQGNPGLRAEASRLRADREDVAIARSFLLPHIMFEERFMRTNNPTYAFMAKLNQERFTMADFSIPSLNGPEPISDFQTSISVEQALFAPQAYIGRRMAEQEYEAREADVGRKKEEIILAVFRTYLDAQTATLYVSVAEQGMADAAEHLRISESRYAAGLGLYSDVLRAQVAVRSAEERKFAAEKNRKVAMRALGLLIGLDDSVSVDGQRPSLPLREPEQYAASALSRNDLMAMEARHRNAINNLGLATSAYLPTIGVGGSWQMNSHKAAFGEEGESWQAVAFLRWNIFDGFRRESERRKAEHQLAEAGEHLAGMKKQISFEIYEAFLAVEEARQGLELARANAASADEGRRLVKARYENSLSTMVDMLDVQTQLDAARADVVAREASYLTAIARLSYLSGTILQDLEIDP